jgi:5-dehydro-2-deoxygluconokinase
VIQTVKCLCFYHPDDDDDLKARQERELIRVFDAARTVGRELMIEIVAGTIGACGDDTVASILERLYGLGIRPDWWKLEPQATQQAWSNIDRVIETSDPRCRGVVLLGLEAPEEELARSFEIAAGSRHVRGFAVGRTIFFDAATAWREGRIDDAAAIADMATRFRRLVSAWQEAEHKTPAA